MKDACIICCESMLPSNTMTALFCGHVFHASCIEMWFTTENNGSNGRTCPQCRCTVNESNIIRKLYFAFAREENGELEQDNQIDESCNEKGQNLESESVSQGYKNVIFSFQNSMVEMQNKLAENTKLIRALKEDNRIKTLQLRTLKGAHKDLAKKKAECKTLRSKCIAYRAVTKYIDDEDCAVPLEQNYLNDIDSLKIFSKSLISQLKAFKDETKRRTDENKKLRTFIKKRLPKKSFSNTNPDISSSSKKTEIIEMESPEPKLKIPPPFRNLTESASCDKITSFTTKSNLVPPNYSKNPIPNNRNIRKQTHVVNDVLTDTLFTRKPISCSSFIKTMDDENVSFNLDKIFVPPKKITKVELPDENSPENITNRLFINIQRKKMENMNTNTNVYPLLKSSILEKGRRKRK